MQFGWCGSTSVAPRLKQAGYDYLELQIVPLNLEDDAAFADAKARVADRALPIRAGSLLFPREFQLVGANADQARALSYFERVVEVLSPTEARVVVLGGGRSRAVPEGWARERAEEQLLTMIRGMADLLDGTSIALAIEPLNRGETNFIVSIEEAVRLADLAARPNVRVLADFLHMTIEHEPASEAERFANRLVHVHVADANRQPPGVTPADYASFFKHLTAGGYSGLISAECFIEDVSVDTLQTSAAFLKEKWAAA